MSFFNFHNEIVFVKVKNTVMRPKRCAFRGSHGEANEILASLIGHTASWA